MGILLWIIFGALAGWLASVAMKSSGGIFSDIILGMLGAVVGGLIMSFFGQAGVTGFNLYSLLVAVAGAVFLIWMGRMFYKV